MIVWKFMTGLFKVFIGAYEKRAGQAAQLKLDLLDVAKTDMSNRASIIKTAMSVKTFWIAWGLFAFPLGFWWALVMIDTTIPARYLNIGVPMLPETIKAYADLIFNSIFYSGAGVAGTQSVVRGILSATVKN